MNENLSPKTMAALQICQAMRKSNVRGTTYLIRVHGYVKIGFTKFENAKARLSELQTACPLPFELLAEIQGGKELEQCLHNLFADLRVRDEWFRDDAELNEFIKSLQSCDVLNKRGALNGRQTVQIQPPELQSTDQVLGRPQ